MPGYTKEDAFELPLEYKGQHMLLPAKLVQMGYSYKIIVTVNDREIVFEPDEERQFRAIVEGSSDQLPMDLIRAIGASLEKNFR